MDCVMTRLYLQQRKSNDLIAVCRYTVIVRQETHYYGCERVAALFGCSKWGQTSATLNVVPMKQIKNEGGKSGQMCFSLLVSRSDTRLSHTDSFCCFVVLLLLLYFYEPSTCFFTSNRYDCLWRVRSCQTLEFPAEVTAILIIAPFGCWKKKAAS